MEGELRITCRSGTIRVWYGYVLHRTARKAWRYMEVPLGKAFRSGKISIYLYLQRGGGILSIYTISLHIYRAPKCIMSSSRHIDTIIIAT